MRRPLAALAPIVAVVLSAATASGQDFDLRILDEGKPVEGATVVGVGDEGPVTIGSTDADGGLVFEGAVLDVLDFGKGTTVEVWIKECEDGKVEYVLVEQGEDDPCVDEDAEAGEGCGCRRLGTFVVGDGPVTVDAGRGTVTQGPAVEGPAIQEPTTEGPRIGLSRERFSLGLGADYLYYDNWERVACDQPDLDRCSAGSSGFGAFFSLGYDPTWVPYGLGLRLDVGYGTAPDVSQSYPGTDVEIDTDFLFIAPRVEVPIVPDRLGLGLSLGAEALLNRSDFRFLGGGGEPFDRNEWNWNGVVGVSRAWPFSDRDELNTGLYYSTNFSGNDADSGIWRFRAEYRHFFAPVSPRF